MPLLLVLVNGTVLVRFFRSKCSFVSVSFLPPLLGAGFAFGRDCAAFSATSAALLFVDGGAAAAAAAAACLAGVSSSRSIASALSLAGSADWVPFVALGVLFDVGLVSSPGSVETLAGCGVGRTLVGAAGLVCFLGLVERC